MVSDQIIRFFEFSWVLVNLLVLIPLYLGRYNINSKKVTIRIVIIQFVIILYGLLIQNNIDQGLNFTSDEVVIFLILGALITSLYVVPLILGQNEFKYTQDFKLKPKIALDLIKNSYTKMRSNIIQEKDSTLQVRIKANYGLEYNHKVILENTEPTKLQVNSTPSGTTVNYLRIIHFLTAYPVLYSLGYNKFELTLPVFNTRLDTEVTFFILIVIYFLYILAQNAIQKNFFFEFEEIESQIIQQMAKNAVVDKSEEESSDKKSLLPIDLEAAKEKAAKIREVNLKTALEEKKKVVQDRIEKVIGRDPEATDGVDAKLIQKEILISLVKRTLNSTPASKSVKIDELVKKLNYKNEDEIERIITGLIEHNEISGTYDIWKKIYSPVEINTQLIELEKTLKTMDLSTYNIESIKITPSGEVEIKFNNTEETNHK